MYFEEFLGEIIEVVDCVWCWYCCDGGVRVVLVGGDVEYGVGFFDFMVELGLGFGLGVCG